MNKLFNSKFEEFCTIVNSLEDYNTPKIAVTTESLSISRIVSKYDLNRKDWLEVFKDTLKELESTCNELNIPYSLGSIEISTIGEKKDYKYGSHRKYPVGFRDE